MTDGRSGGKAERGRDAKDRPPFPEALPREGRLLGVDWGEKRIGLALSDPDQRVAHPLDTLARRAGRRFPMQRLRVHLDEHRPVGVVLGLPLESDGSEGMPAQAAREAGELIAEKTGLPVAFVDERMSTAKVLQTVKEMGGGSRGRRGEVDRLAATVLLQLHLDSVRR